MLRRLTLAALAVALAAAVPAGAQERLTRPWLDWRSVRTAHFDIHYPQAMSEWTLDMATRLESVHEAVRATVGSAPAERVTVIVEDPANVSNGFALPFINAPTIFLFPTPPDPASSISANRGWGEILAVHEFAHVAHMARPSRNPRDAILWRLLPVRLGPIARRAPRWVFEGYATVVEGRLTGTGRPRGVWRAAVLRQWALEGKLPTYGQLNSTQGYQAGAMAYLAGSAFLEWLVEQKGDSSLVHLWRRMTARQSRSFDDAFAGVFGGQPADLYGRFTAELTGRALEIEQRIDSAGRANGTVVQKLQWHTGHPDVSPDGKLLALTLRSKDVPGRLVTIRSVPDTITDKERQRRERMLQRDPEDVPAIEWMPRPRKPVATLHARAGRAYDMPSFLADGERVLAVRSVAQGDGTERSELFVWNTRTGDVRRVTRGAGVRSADPSPDGTRAVAARCLNGICDLVRIDLRSGRVDVLHRGAPRVAYSTPRYSPDGRQVSVTVQRGDTVRVALTDDAGAPLKFVGPDDGARRFDASFSRDGRALFVVSERGGIPNVERIDLASGAPEPVTRVTGAALAPAPSPTGDSLYFLSLHSKGLDLNLIRPDTIGPGAPLALDTTLAPAIARGVFVADTFAASALPPARSYGLGPRPLRVLPSIAYGTDGWAPGLALSSADPIGRFSWVLQGAYPFEGAWGGGSLAATWRGFRPALRGQLFGLRQRPSAGDDAVLDEAFDGRYAGAAFDVSLDRDFDWRAHQYRAGASAGRLRAAENDEDADRRFAHAEYAGSYRFTRGRRALAIATSLHGAAGRTDDRDWRRGVAGLTLAARAGDNGLRVDGTAGFVTSDAPAFEQMLLGGMRPSLIDATLLSQRLTMPALPLGARGGSQAAAVRVSIPNGGFEPFYWVGSAGRAFDDWVRVVGFETRTSVGTLAGPALAGLTGVTLTSGVAYSLDEPMRKKVRSYVAIEWRP